MGVLQYTGPCPVYFFHMTPGELHHMIMGEDPNEVHTALYTTGKAGYSSKEFDEDRFTAVIVLTLQKTMRKSLHQPERVILFIPPSHDTWVMAQLEKVADRCFNALKRLPGTTKSRIQLTQLIGECFKRIFVGSRLLQLPEVPEAWTSFGFAKSDPIPNWMRDGLRE